MSSNIFFIRHRISKKMLLLLAGDILIFYSALYLALMFRYGTAIEQSLMRKHFLSFSAVFPLWLLMFGASGFYDFRMLRNEKVFLYRLIRVMAFATGAAAIIFYLFPFEIEPRRNLFVIAAIAGIAVFLWRYAFNLLIMHRGAARIAFLGFNKEMQELADYLALHPQLGHHPVAFITGRIETLPLPDGVLHIPLNHANLAREIRNVRADMVVISPEMKSSRETVGVLLSIIPFGVSVAEFLSFHEALTGKIPLSLIGEVWFLENLIGLKKRGYEFLKRATDIAIALLVAPAALALVPILALAHKIDSPGPVFFRQARVGRHGKTFSVLKFRSMVQHADTLSPYKGNGQGDPRITRVGSFLRKSYLDELPQIWNIFKGEMSFVGPRPERPEFVSQLREKIPYYEARLLALPGITGWAQVNMENDASVEDAPEKMQYDLYYIKNCSVLLDTLIAMRTLATIVQRKGR